MSKPAPHSLTDSQFINLILNPVKEDGSPDPDGFYFKPLSDELVVNEETGGMMLQDPQAYLYRFLQTPGNEHYGDYLKSTKPNETTAGDIAYQNMYADSWIQSLGKDTPLVGPMEMPDAVTIGADYLVKEALLGMSHEELPYVSQEEYKKRTDAGESIMNIFPYAKQHNTLGDYTVQGHMNQGFYGRALFEAEAQGTLDLSPQGFYDAIFKPSGKEQADKEMALYERKYGGKPGKEFLDSENTAAYRTRKEWYEAGGEIDENGVWVDKNGKPASWLERTFKHSEIEYRTKEKYEKRIMDKQPFFTEGFKEGVMQNLIYEWVNPATDGAMAEMLEQKIERMKDPEFIEFQEWSRANPWTMDTGKWSWGGFGMKVTNLLTGTVPSYATAIGVGITMSALTKSPFAATLGASIAGGALDASDTWMEAYEYFTSEEGGNFSDHDARMMAYQHYETYLVASMAWESIPFSKLFRKVQPNRAARKTVVRNINDSRLKSFAHDMKEALINVGPVAGSKMKAMATQGFAESITELGQYTTQTAIQAGYKDKDFMDVFDVQEALDSVLGGLLMGSATGVFGGKVQEGTTQPGSPINVQNRGALPTSTSEPTQLPAGQGQLPPTGGTINPTDTDSGVPVPSYPTTVGEYLSQIAQSDKDNTALSVELITLKKQLGGENSALDKAIFKQGSSRYDLPVEKLFDIMMNPELNPEGGLAFIENSDLDEGTKDRYKRELMQKYKTVMGRPYDKKTLTKDEMDKKSSIDNLDIDTMIESASQGSLPTIDEVLEKQIEMEALKQEQENLKGQTFEDLEKQGKTGTTDEINIDTKTEDTPTPTKTKPAPIKTKPIPGPLFGTGRKKKGKKTKAPETDIQRNERQLKEQGILKEHWEKQLAKGKTKKALKEAMSKLNAVNKRIMSLEGEKAKLSAKGKEEIEKAFDFGDKKETTDTEVTKKTKPKTLEEIADAVEAAGQSQEELAKQFEAAQKEQQDDFVSDEEIDSDEKKRQEDNKQRKSKEEIEKDLTQKYLRPKDGRSQWGLVPEKVDADRKEQRDNVRELRELFTEVTGDESYHDENLYIKKIAEAMAGGAVPKKKVAKKKAAPKPAPVINIDLGSAINAEISDIIGDKDANDIGDVQEGSSLSEESLNKINDAVEESVDEIVKTNCLKGNE